MKMTVVSMLAVGLAMASQHAFAQITEDAPVVYGHHHLTVTSIEASKKFWVDTLGGKLVKVGEREYIMFPSVFVLLRQGTPSGGSKGTSVNHVGFEVPNVRAMVEKVRAAGYPIVTKAETQYPEENGVATVAALDTHIAFVMGPDDMKVELVENKAMTEPIALHHIHFFTPQPVEMQAWYAKTFHAKPGKRGPFDAADLPGVNLTFSKSTDPVVTTKGRVLDHIGFEVKGLEAFCKNLESQGIKLDRQPGKAPGTDITIAFLTDPWGTYIELTEGLNKIH